MAGRIAVGVSGAGSNLRALQARAARGALDAEIALVFSDRPCPALDWAAEQGIGVALVPGLAARDPAERAAGEQTLLETLRALEVEALVLAVPPEAVGVAIAAASAAGVEALAVGEIAPVGEVGGRYAEAEGPGPDERGRQSTTGEG